MGLFWMDGSLGCGSDCNYLFGFPDFHIPAHWGMHQKGAVMSKDPTPTTDEPDLPSGDDFPPEFQAAFARSLDRLRWDRLARKQLEDGAHVRSG
jgi:hypothetical protein